MALRVVFAGTPEAAVPALRACAVSDHAVVQVLSQPPRPRGRRGTPQPSPVQIAAEELGLPVATPPDLQAPDVLAMVRQHQPDIGVVVAYGHILRPAWLESLPLGWINVHFSLLPRWRGAAPVAAAIRAGDEEAGVSVIRIVPKLDAGPLLSTERTRISEHETRGELTERLARLGAPLVAQVLDALAAGALEETAQDEAGVTTAPRLEKQAGRIQLVKR